MRHTIDVDSKAERDSLPMLGSQQLLRNYAKHFNVDAVEPHCDYAGLVSQGNIAGATWLQAHQSSTKHHSMPVL